MQTPATHQLGGFGRLAWAFWIALLAVGVGAIIGIVLVSRSQPRIESGPSSDAVSWPAGARRAPNFDLVDQNGKPISLEGLRGRPVLLTFIDPVCRSLCPREASILSQAARQLGTARPAIVAVSVDPWADSTGNYRQDASHWKLLPTWRWAVGSYSQLDPVWKHYAIGVTVSRQTIAGVLLRKIIHTEATYVIDGSGHERALLVYPFTTSDVVSAVDQTLTPSKPG